jgi:hypothetical protein
MYTLPIQCEVSSGCILHLKLTSSRVLMPNASLFNRQLTNSAHRTSDLSNILLPIRNWCPQCLGKLLSFDIIACLFQAATRTLRTTHACEAQVAERSFSRLPTHPYVQWWNAAFATIVNAHLLPSLRSLSLCSS